MSGRHQLLAFPTGGRDSHMFAEAAGLERLDLETGHPGQRPNAMRELAGWTGLEPAASGVTGRRSNQLNYHPRG